MRAWRDRLVAVAIAAIVTAGLAPALPTLAGLSIDVGFWLRELAFGPRYAPETSPAVVIAVDEESSRTEPLADRPQALWTPELARVIDAVIAGGATVIGFDVIFPTSASTIVGPDGDRPLRNYDRGFLQSLQRAARQDRIVLSRVQHLQVPIRPHPAQSFAVGNQRNIRAVNLIRDDDEVIRRVPLYFSADDVGGGVRTEPSLALELAQRAVGRPATRGPDGRVTFNGQVVPGSERENLVLNFEAGSTDIPTYSLVDLVRCAAESDEAFFRRAFQGRVVLIGAVLGVEDRKLTSKRMITAAETGQGPRCRLPPPQGLYREDVVRDSIPGVYVHATAVNNLLRGDALSETGQVAALTIAFIAALLGAGATLVMAPLWLLGGVVAGTAAWAGASAYALQHALVLPLFAPPVAVMLSAALTLGWRFIVADRDKRVLRRSFGLYLAPALVDRLVAAERPPELGGEEREVSIFFSDLAGFSKMSQGMAPAALVALMNDYLTAMTDIIEAHGGFVDKYIGDAIVAIFGAPVDSGDHAASAAAAALACQARLAELNRDDPLLSRAPLAMRIGLNTGTALVGNIGSRRRFNYTVMGDTVNVASRLEGANKAFGLYVLAAEATAAAAPRIAWREVDRIRVVGRSAPLTVFTPVGDSAPEIVRCYGEALAAFRARDFSRAAAIAAGLDDAPARALVARARAYRESPPGDDWDGVNELESK